MSLLSPDTGRPSDQILGLASRTFSDSHISRSQKLVPTAGSPYPCHPADLQVHLCTLHNEVVLYYEYINLARD